MQTLGFPLVSHLSTIGRNYLPAWRSRAWVSLGNRGPAHSHELLVNPLATIYTRDCLKHDFQDETNEINAQHVDHFCQSDSDSSGGATATYSAAHFTSTVTTIVTSRTGPSTTETHWTQCGGVGSTRASVSRHPPRQNNLPSAISSQKHQQYSKNIFLYQSQNF